MTLIRKFARTILPADLHRRVKKLISVSAAIKPLSIRCCPLCGYEGYFEWFGRPPRIDAQCPNCDSLERHRLFYLSILRGEASINNKEVLHFAAEKQLKKIIQPLASHYVTADLMAPADLTLNIENIDLPDNSFDVIVVNHVLEHVDFTLARRELSRVLRPRGLLICSVPQIANWKKTYEPADVDPSDNELHFGQYDHIRYFGADFCMLMCEDTRFSLNRTHVAEGKDVITYGLLRGEMIHEFVLKG